MKSTLIVGIGASLLTAGIAKAQQRQDITPRTPNVLFIYADDLGYGDLECYDGTQVKTPNINRLAKNGIRFTNAHATASTSTPSRYSMLTGEYAWRRPGTDIAAGNAGMIIRPERYTIADMFKNAGYATAAIGKWHLGLGDKAGEQDWNAPLPTALGDLGLIIPISWRRRQTASPAYSSRTGRWRTTIRTPRSMSVTSRTFPESRPEKIIRNYYTTRSLVSGTTNPS